MPRYLITLRRERRGSAKPALDAVKQFPDVSVEQVHSDDMVTVDTSEETATKLKEAIGGDFHIEPEMRRSLL